MIDRRRFLGTSLALAGSSAAFAEGGVKRTGGSRIKLALNAYSFDRALRDGSMTYDDVVRYCAEQGFDGLDATGYYFPGYPKVPSDDYIYALKRTAFLNGISISGTGVRNDFTVPDAASRQTDVQMVKAWIEVAGKLGAPVIRVFTGPKGPEGRSFDQVLDWMAADFRECADYGRRHGVIVALQEHNDFLHTAEETIRVVSAVNSDWFGVILDVGSLRRTDPYREIEKLLPYAVSWQIKQTVWYDTKETPVDLAKIRAIIDKVGYRGYLPIEALGGGDSKVKVAQFLTQVRQAFGA